MPPTHDLERSTGEQGIVVHAPAVNRQAAFAAQGIVARQLDRPARGEGRQQQAIQAKPQILQAPNGCAEEAMVARMVAVVGRATGEDQFGDEAWSKRETPTGKQRFEGVEAGLSKGANSCSNTTNARVSCMDGLLGARNPDVYIFRISQPQGGRLIHHECTCSKSAKPELRKTFSASAKN